MEHTKGKVKIGDANLPKHAYYGIHGEQYVICDICNDGYDEDEQNANANLIIDAFNTTNESGLTPSQLYKQNQEFLDIVYKAHAVCDKLQMPSESELNLLKAICEQAINNAKTKI